MHGENMKLMHSVCVVQSLVTVNCIITLSVAQQYSVVNMSRQQWK